MGLLCKTFGAILFLNRFHNNLFHENVFHRRNSLLGLDSLSVRFDPITSGGEATMLPPCYADVYLILSARWTAMFQFLKEYLLSFTSGRVEF